MDIGLILGFAVGIGSIVGSFLWEGGNLKSLFLGPALLVIVGGTLSTAMVGLPMRRFFDAWRLLGIALLGQKQSPKDLINELVSACEKARKDGLLALQKDINNLKMPFTRKYMKMFVNGTEAEIIRQASENELDHMRVRHSAGANVFSKLGGYSPTMGIIGTVMGLVNTLGHAGGDPTHLIHAIAGAFIATLWGVLTANVIFLPISDKLKNKDQDENLIHALTLEGIECLQAGYSPRIVRMRLVAMLTNRDQLKMEVGKDAGKPAAAVAAAA